MIGLGGRHADSQGQSSSPETAEGKKFDTALFAALEALEECQVIYAVIGGIAVTGLGRPRSTQDIDVFVRPEDAEAVLSVLDRKGFRTEQTNPTWLFKAFKEDVLVDVIFRSQGGFYLDDEMAKRRVMVNYHGKQVRLVGPEDFILIKVAAASEEGPHHWHDALSVLSHSQLDWDYLLHRARKSPRRLLALLIYAQSDDIWIPNHVIQQLHKTVFGDHPPAAKAAPPKKETEATPSVRPLTGADKASSDAYLGAKIREALIETGAAASSDVEVWVEGGKVLVRGQCLSAEQCQGIRDLVRQMAPGFEIVDQVKVADLSNPPETKDLT